jgi:N-acetyl-anhydromuramyl-L-alanine amidase AmpD
MIAKTKYPEQVKLSPQTNGKYAQKITPKAIVMHDTAGAYLGSIDWTGRIINPSTGKRLYASYHCIIARDGRRTITNEDDNRAYHAGLSTFKGKNSLNGWSIGVAFERNSHTEPLQKEAIESAIEYIIPRMKKWGITPEWVTDHRTIAPVRKVDLHPKEFAKFKVALEEAWNKA